MITLAVVTGVIVYVYASGLMGPLVGAKVQQPYGERITLDYYNWTSTSLILILRNTGSAQITLADFFIAGQPIACTPASCFSACSSGLSVNAPGCKVTLPTVLGNCASTVDNCGVAYDVRVVTTDGAIFDFTCIAGAAS
jgi:hypothetical protein